MMVSDVSATEPDWSREVPQWFWDPSRKLLRAIRCYQRAGNRASRFWWRQVHRFWSVVTQADIPLECQIGGGLVLPHPNGIVIHPKAVIGPNCLIFQQVTIGMAADDGVPVIGGHVDIGAGARILGPVRLGNDVVVGANAVVTRDIPAGHVARGIPARAHPRAPA
ncbi:MAG: serine O-acetyltransferase [Roseinatronobacter sp.]